MDVKIVGLKKEVLERISEIAKSKEMTTEEFMRKWLIQIANDPISDDEDGFDICRRISRITKEEN